MFPKHATTRSWRLDASFLVLAILLCLATGQECDQGVIPLPPVVVAGAGYQYVAMGDDVALRADAVDPDGDDTLLVYQWAALAWPQGVIPVISDGDSAEANFAPPALGDYTFRCAVSDGEYLIQSNLVYITVVEERGTPAPPDGPPTDNHAPRITGAELIGPSGIAGNRIDMQATGVDDDGDPIWFMWSRVSGPSVNIYNANSANAYFFSPDVSQRTQMVFRVTCGDTHGATTHLDLNYTANVEPYLAMSLTEELDPVYPGTTYDYTLRLINQSNNKYLTGVHAVVEYPIADLQLISSGGGTPSGDTISWTVSSIPPGQYHDLTYTVRVRDNVTGLPKQVGCSAVVTVNEFDGSGGTTEVTQILPLPE